VVYKYKISKTTSAAIRIAYIILFRSICPPLVTEPRPGRSESGTRTNWDVSPEKVPDCRVVSVAPETSPTSCSVEELVLTQQLPSSVTYALLGAPSAAAGGDRGGAGATRIRSAPDPASASWSPQRPGGRVPPSLLPLHCGEQGTVRPLRQLDSGAAHHGRSSRRTAAPWRSRVAPATDGARACQDTRASESRRAGTWLGIRAGEGVARTVARVRDLTRIQPDSRGQSDEAMCLFYRHLRT
jgi:hypothetical protein